MSLFECAEVNYGLLTSESQLPGCFEPHGSGLSHLAEIMPLVLTQPAPMCLAWRVWHAAASPWERVHTGRWALLW
jgi:hypothetical protein